MVNESPCGAMMALLMAASTSSSSRNNQGSISLTMAVVYSRHLIYITFVMHMICSTFSFTPSMTTISKQTYLTSTKGSIFDQQVDDMFTKYGKSEFVVLLHH